jgi:hypothetical protein
VAPSTTFDGQGLNEMVRTLEDLLRDRPVDHAEVERLKAELLAVVRAESSKVGSTEDPKSRGQ